MNIAHIEEHSYIYGPGCRFVIWVQGCSIRCSGCWNQKMWSFQKRNEITIQSLLKKISKETEHIEGITLLGGEPLDQYEEVVSLLVACRNINLSTMVFTGYEMNEIYDKGFNKILNYSDILITGRYEKKKRTINHQWIGSTNQNVLFLSDRYKNYELMNKNFVEISIDESGKITTLGFPDKETLCIINNLPAN